MATKLGKHYRKGRELMKAAGGKVEAGLHEFILEGQQVIEFKKECQSAGLNWEKEFREQQEDIGYSLAAGKQYARLARQPQLVNEYLKQFAVGTAVPTALPSLTGALTYVRKKDPREPPKALTTSPKLFVKKVQRATRLSNELAGLLADIQEEHETHEYDIDATVQADFYGAIETLQAATQGQFTTSEKRRRPKEVA